MNIDQAYRLVNSIVNKDQRGYVKPSDFNNWAIVSQIEAISDRLTNVKKLNERMVPQYGYKIDAKVKNELRELITGPVALPLTAGLADYPADYFYIDSIQTDEYIRIAVIDTDQYADVKQSLIYPPDALHPVAVFYGDKIRIDPSATAVLWTYLRYPEDPNWDYTMVSGDPVYNSTNVPGVTGKISHNFEVDRSMHTEICWRICKYAGMNIDMTMVTQMAMAQEASGV